jgi:Mrp family chromosome partitioning ATPase
MKPYTPEKTSVRISERSAASAPRDLPQKISPTRELKLPSSSTDRHVLEQQMSALMAMTFKLIDERGSAVIQLTSAKAGEGTTTAAFELARAAALSSWCKVVLVNAGKPQTAMSSSIPSGFEKVDNEAEELDLRPVRVEGADFVLGELNRAGDFGLQLDKVRKHYSWLRSNFTLVIVDCPPALESGEAATIASLADGIILVVEAQKSTITAVERARDLLLQAGGTIFGVILNKRPLLPPALAKFE